MLKATCLVLAACVVLMAGLTQGLARQSSVEPGRHGLIDTVQFLKQFRIGMAFSDVQRLLPKDLPQSTLEYNIGENVFLLEVGDSESDEWSAYFIFSTSDGSLRKPETLIEMDCSSTLKSATEGFDAVVRSVSGAFGAPIKLDPSAGQPRTRRAGWEAPGGSVLTLEYTEIGGSASSVQRLVDFVVRRPIRHEPSPRTIG